MKLSIVVMLVCLAGAEANFAQHFFDKILEQLEYGWNSFINFMKRPSRSRRTHAPETTETTADYWWSTTISSTIITKATTNKNLPKTVKNSFTTSTTTSPKPPLDEIVQTTSPEMIHYFQRSRHQRVLLPFFPRPKWRMDRWNQIQESPDIMPWRDQFPGGSAGRPFAFVDEDVTTTKEFDQHADDGIGVMMFV
ncbi:uncharacterized protein LOC125233358 isoform X1 [Leguminivora glycinivorella]|uniref:uncharacterized protein LOC125233358 isoform X1 n=1 Tax=Leguminivora glycinivorella TaxID=1035111 RepID=UPI00200F079B|nr:uncharacterized protein LOC125233358 isoform X1 [Leguminivora glycinivorella]